MSGRKRGLASSLGFSVLDIIFCVIPISLLLGLIFIPIFGEEINLQTMTDAAMFGLLFGGPPALIAPILEFAFKAEGDLVGLAFGVHFLGVVLSGEISPAAVGYLVGAALVLSYHFLSKKYKLPF